MVGVAKMSFEFKRLEIQDVILIKPKVFGDERGFFLETYKTEDFERAGIKGEFVQDNYSKSERGVLRGLQMDNIITKRNKIRGKVN